MTTTIIIFLAKYLIVASGVIFAGALYLARDRWLFLRTAVAIAVVAFVLSRGASLLYNNPRPFMLSGVSPVVYHAPGNGFPSDHALASSVIAAIVMLTNPLLGLLAWVVAALVSTGRVLAQVHHTVDVVASGLIALLSALIVRAFERRSV